MNRIKVFPFGFSKGKEYRKEHLIDKINNICPEGYHFKRIFVIDSANEKTTNAHFSTRGIIIFEED